MSAMRPKKPITPDAARLRMAGLCARAEHCEHEISDKLYRMGLSSEDTHKVIAYLTENRFIDNARYARSFARDKVRFSGWGRNKIRMYMAANRLSADDIKEGLDAIDETDYEVAAARVADAKARVTDLTDRTGLQSLYRHLLSRGFESEIAVRQIARLRKQNGR